MNKLLHWFQIIINSYTFQCLHQYQKRPMESPCSKIFLKVHPQFVFDKKMKQNFQLSYFYREKENAILQKKAAVKKAFSTLLI